MHGNVWELCRDSFDERFYSSPEATRDDPLCESGPFQEPDRKVLRGGGWWSSSDECRSAARSPIDGDMRSVDPGPPRAPRAPPGGPKPPAPPPGYQ